MVKNRYYLAFAHLILKYFAVPVLVGGKRKVSAPISSDFLVRKKTNEGYYRKKELLMFGINQGGTHLHYHSMHQPSYTLLPKHYYLTTTYLPR